MPMNFDQFVLTVASMRDHQKAYFKQRHLSDLLEAKRLEGLVDEALKEGIITELATDEPKPDQPELFGDEQ